MLEVKIISFPLKDFAISSFANDRLPSSLTVIEVEQESSDVLRTHNPEVLFGLIVQWYAGIRLPP